MLLGIAWLGCSESEGATRERRTLVLTGSSTVAPLASEIGKRFEQLHPGVRIDVQSGGSSRGIADRRQGVCDLGMISRGLKEEEVDLLAFTIARDGIALIVHKDNSVRSLSDAEVIAIYTGRSTNWSEFGGPDAPITVINKAEGRSTLELFLEHFRLKNSEIKPQVIIGDNEQGIKTVAGNPHAICYVSIGSADVNMALGVAIRLLPLGGVEPTLENVASGRFPISRPLNLISTSKPLGLVHAFLEFAQSEAVHDLVRSQYFVPLLDR